MLNVSFQSLGLSTVQIFLIGAVGYVLAKRKILKEEGLKTLSYLVVYVFLPCLIFVRFTQDFSFDQYPQWWIFPFLSLMITLAGFLVGQGVLSVAKNLQAKNEFLALTSFQNSGYIPLIIAVQVFPPEQAAQLSVYIFLFLIGFDFAIWSLGVSLVIGREKLAFRPRDALTPPFFATALSLGIVLAGVQKFIPEAVVGPIEMFGSCALPIAISVVGGNLAFMAIGHKAYRREVILAVLSKIVLLPSLALAIVFLLRIKGMMGFLIVLQSVVPSATTLVVMVKHFNVQEKFISEAIFFSHLAGLIATPLFLMAYLKLTTFY